jgi:hypothetical protein
MRVCEKIQNENTRDIKCDRLTLRQTREKNQQTQQKDLRRKFSTQPPPPPLTQWMEKFLSLTAAFSHDMYIQGEKRSVYKPKNGGKCLVELISPFRKHFFFGISAFAPCCGLNFLRWWEKTVSVSFLRTAAT